LVQQVSLFTETFLSTLTIFAYQNDYGNRLVIPNSTESMPAYERITHDPISVGSNSKQTQRSILSIPAIH